MLVKSIGSVIFETPIFVLETDEPSDVVGEDILTAGGTLISYVAIVHTPYLTVSSRDGSNETVDEQQKEELKVMNKNLGAEYTLVFEDGTTTQVVFARSSSSLGFNPIFTGSCVYRVNIPLIKKG